MTEEEITFILRRIEIVKKNMKIESKDALEDWFVKNKSNSLAFNFANTLHNLLLIEKIIEESQHG